MSCVYSTCICSCWVIIFVHFNIFMRRMHVTYCLSTKIIADEPSCGPHNVIFPCCTHIAVKELEKHLSLCLNMRCWSGGAVYNWITISCKSARKMSEGVLKTFSLTGMRSCALSAISSLPAVCKRWISHCCVAWGRWAWPGIWVSDPQPCWAQRYPCLSTRRPAANTHIRHRNSYCLSYLSTKITVPSSKRQERIYVLPAILGVMIYVLYENGDKLKHFSFYNGI